MTASRPISDPYYLTLANGPSALPAGVAGSAKELLSLASILG